MSSAGRTRPPIAKVNSFDENDAQCGASLLAGSESMDVSNDPRFFASNVMDKRLAAFKSLTIVSSLMFGTSLGQCFKLKKNMDFQSYEPYVGSIAIWQAAGFLISVVVAFMCLLSLYVIAHQLFYTYRLMTAGPTGFEQASVFYLTRVITVWRHIAIKCLFNGLWAFMALVGIQLFVTFYKDADSEKSGAHAVWAMNLVGGTSQNTTVISLTHHHKLDMTTHAVLGYVVFAIFMSCAFLLAYVRYQHLRVFRENYMAIKAMTDPIQQNMKEMYYSYFMDRLEDTVRTKIGLSLERSYENLPAMDAAKMLILPDIAKLQEFVVAENERKTRESEDDPMGDMTPSLSRRVPVSVMKWEVKEGRLHFTRSAEKRAEIWEDLMVNTIGYATDLERIV